MTSFAFFSLFTSSNFSASIQYFGLLDHLYETGKVVVNNEPTFTMCNYLLEFIDIFSILTG